MGKKNKGNKNKGQYNGPRHQQSAPSPQKRDLDLPVAVIVDKAYAAAKSESVDETKIDTADLRVVAPEDLTLAHSLFLAATDSAKRREAQAEQKTADLENREEQLLADKARLADDRRNNHDERVRLSADKAEVERRTKDFENREKNLLDREIENERRSSELVASLHKKAHDEVLGPLLAARADLIKAEKDRFVESLNEHMSRIAAVEKREVDLARREREFALQVDQFNAEQHERDEEVSEREKELTSDLERRLSREKAKSERLEQKLSRHVELESALLQIRELTGNDPIQLKTELDHLQSRVRQLESELSKRPSESLGNHFNEVEARVHQLDSELLKIRSENEKLKAEISSFQNLALERDRMIRENDVLKSSNTAYERRIEELNQKFKDLVRQESNRPPFPECSAMDVRESLQSPPQNFLDHAPPLDDLAKTLQQSLAFRSSHEGPPLYFDIDEIRIFLAGMAMSRLHILEGVSGTGKTSLPIAIARSLGGHFAKIEVQAGWRDNRDLLGYYNEFEKHFREHEFTRALYEALTPRYRDGIYFVVLDEMNLSKPEQYFADYLSLLEDREGADLSKKASVMLNDQSVHGLPKMMVESERGGVELPLGDNVWFIGTANHDETTASFAPKTQSRAHMMELPRRHPNRESIQPTPGHHKYWGKTLKHSSLTQQFHAAEQEYSNEANRADEFFGKILEVLENYDEEFSWGPRITRQINRFVPTVIASGGTLGLAVDHLLFTKLTRRLQNSFSPEMRQARSALRESIVTNWPCRKVDPVESKAIKNLDQQVARQ